MKTLLEYLNRDRIRTGNSRMFSEHSRFWVHALENMRIHIIHSNDNMSVSFNGESWVEMNDITLDRDQYMFIWANKVKPQNIVYEGCFEIGGNLLSYNEPTLNSYKHINTIKKYQYDAAFMNTNCVNAEKLIIDAKVAEEDSLRYLFCGCKNLITGPNKIIIGKAANESMSFMFEDCKLRKTPEIVITTSIRDIPMDHIFMNCYDLEYANIQLADIDMLTLWNTFNGCRNLLEVNLTLPDNVSFEKDAFDGWLLGTTGGTLNIHCKNMTPDKQMVLDTVMEQYKNWIINYN